MDIGQRSSGHNLVEEIAAYAADFELIRIGMWAGCKRQNPNGQLERLWTLVYRALPAAGTEMSELIVAHRRAVCAFRDLSCREAPSAAVKVARASHYAALAALCQRLAVAANQPGTPAV